MDVVVLADTHLQEGLDGLTGRLVDALRRSDAVIHAGDVVSAAALRELAGLNPLHAVLGNNDRELVGVLPESLQLVLGGVRVAVIHDSGQATARAGRMARRFPEAQLVVFGHSHAPLIEEGVGGQVLFNPGSPTQRRAQPRPTFGRLRLSHGRIEGRAIEPLELRHRR